MSGESRNVLVESARIARVAVRELGEIDSLDFNALILQKSNRSQACGLPTLKRCGEQQTRLLWSQNK